MIVLAAGAFAQGTVWFDNGTPTSLSPGATSGGAFFVDSWTSGLKVLDDPVGLYHATLFGGATPNSLTPLASDVLMDDWGGGEYVDDSGNGYAVNGVRPGDTAFFMIQIWSGNYPSLAAAEASWNPFNWPYSESVVCAQSTVFSSSTGTQSSPTFLTGMPAVILRPIPEPGPFALVSLGGVVLGICRRRKQGNARFQP